MGKLLSTLDELDDTGQIGDWCFMNDDADMMLRHPVRDEGGRGEVCHLYLRTKDKPNAQTPCWDWDGNRESPTVSPSIRVWDGKGDQWHGYLRQGNLVNA